MFGTLTVNYINLTEYIIVRVVKERSKLTIMCGNAKNNQEMY